MTKTFGPPERRECHDCGITRTLEFFTDHDVLCDDCFAKDLAAQLILDRLIYGSSFLKVDRDGKQQRVDPRRILIQDADVEQDWGGDHIADTNQERTL